MFVYGRNVLEDIIRLWFDLKIIYSGVNEFWCVCGDCNVVKDINNRINGICIIINEIKDFRNFLDICNMFEINVVGK